MNIETVVNQLSYIILKLEREITRPKIPKSSFLLEFNNKRKIVVVGGIQIEYNLVNNYSISNIELLNEIIYHNIKNIIDSDDNYNNIFHTVQIKHIGDSLFIQIAFYSDKVEENSNINSIIVNIENKIGNIWNGNIFQNIDSLLISWDMSSNIDIIKNDIIKITDGNYSIKTPFTTICSFNEIFEIIFGKLLKQSYINLEKTKTNTNENTLFKFEPSFEPSFDPSFEPSFEPSLEPSFEILRHKNIKDPFTRYNSKQNSINDIEYIQDRLKHLLEITTTDNITDL